MTERAPLPETPAIISHLGELLRRARQARGLSQADIARACGVHRSTILHFEEHGQLFRLRETYLRYVQALEAASVGSPDLPINPSRRALLHDLFDHAQRPRIAQDEAHLAAISFGATRDSNAPALCALLDDLQRQPFPAALFDELGFAHALNGAVFKLFGANPADPYYQTWEAWHAFATKLPRASPVRRSYTAFENADLFFTAALYQFVERMHAYRYLFTRQMRALQARLAALARRERYPSYEAGWRLVSALQVIPGIDEALRLVRFEDDYLLLSIAPQLPCRVQLRGNGVIWYTPVIWRPQGALSEQALASFQDSRLFFAADFDRHNAFHVNAWPELRELWHG